MCLTSGGSGLLLASRDSASSSSAGRAPASEGFYLTQNVNNAEVGRLVSGQVDPCGPKLIIWRFKTITPPRISR